MRKTGYFLTLVSFFIFPLTVGTNSYAFECVGPSFENCLQCHAAAGGATPGACDNPDGYLHQNPPEHKALSDDPNLCVVCHCGDLEESPCASTWAAVETQCCTYTCHDLCLLVSAHTDRVVGDDDCRSCHFLPEDPVSCAAATIPTLTEWGVIIFMTLMMGIGVVVIIRKRRMV